MLSDFRKNKMTHLFKMYDTDNNGYIDVHDYLRFLDNLDQQGYMKKSTPAFDKMKSETLALWNALREEADTNRDDRVSLEEWLRWQAKLDDEMKKTGAAFPFEKYVSTVSELMDLDRDGSISIAEYKAIANAYGFTNIDFEGNFKAFDKNGDGKLSKEEVISVFAEFWFSDDPKAQANYIYGRF